MSPEDPRPIPRPEGPPGPPEDPAPPPGPPRPPQGRAAFRDASRGSLVERAAAYRHNRTMSASLPQHMLQWLAACVCALGAAAVFDTLAQSSSGAWPFVALAAACSVAFACALCVLAVYTCTWVWLRCIEA
jgi:hypothetical protein